MSGKSLKKGLKSIIFSFMIPMYTLNSTIRLHCLPLHRGFLTEVLLEFQRETHSAPQCTVF